MLPSRSIGDNVSYGVMCWPGFFLRQETWNVEWILHSTSNASTYVTMPLLPTT